ncbi:MAG: hypothetical protein HFI65_05120 [Lachnospiraceae bacterium]|nr:hypothetical protein [Lachnospiraceae bacterium]
MWGIVGFSCVLLLGGSGFMGKSR